MGRVIYKSFTLIELIVAVGVVGLILPAIFNIFFIMIRQQLVLTAYQTIKQQGDSAQRNIKNILQSRAAYITNSSYTATDVCPLPLTPTPQFSELYIGDRNKGFIHLYSKLVSGTIYSIASDSADISKTVIKTYDLTSNDVTVSDMEFSCHRINDFTPAIISAKFTITKTAALREISLPYIFNIRLRNY